MRLISSEESESARRERCCNWDNFEWDAVSIDNIYDKIDKI